MPVYHVVNRATFFEPGLGRKRDDLKFKMTIKKDAQNNYLDQRKSIHVRNAGAVRNTRYFRCFRASSIGPLTAGFGVVGGDMTERLLSERQFTSALHFPKEQHRYADEQVDWRRRR